LNNNIVISDYYYHYYDTFVRGIRGSELNNQYHERAHKWLNMKKREREKHNKREKEREKQYKNLH